MRRESEMWSENLRRTETANFQLHSPLLTTLTANSIPSNTRRRWVKAYGKHGAELALFLDRYFIRIAQVPEYRYLVWKAKLEVTYWVTFQVWEHRVGLGNGAAGHGMELSLALQSAYVIAFAFTAAEYCFVVPMWNRMSAVLWGIKPMSVYDVSKFCDPNFSSVRHTSYMDKPDLNLSQLLMASYCTNTCCGFNLGLWEDMLSARCDRAVSVLGRLFPAFQRLRFQLRHRSSLFRQQHHSRYSTTVVWSTYRLLQVLNNACHTWALLCPHLYLYVGNGKQKSAMEGSIRIKTPFFVLSANSVYDYRLSIALM